MKYVNLYSGMALVLIASLLGSLGSTTGELAPPLVLGALLATVLVLGWAGGASDARYELDRLTRLEAGRQLLAQSHIRQRDQLEASNEALRAQVKDCQAAIELFTTSQAKNMILITALEGENAELQKRPSADALRATAKRLIGDLMIGREVSSEEAVEDEVFLSGSARGTVSMLSDLLRQMGAPPMAAGAQIESNASQARIDVGVDAASTPLATTVK